MIEQGVSCSRLISTTTVTSNSSNDEIPSDLLMPKKTAFIPDRNQGMWFGAELFCNVYQYSIYDYITVGKGTLTFPKLC